MPNRKLLLFLACLLSISSYAPAQTIIVDDFSNECKLEGVWADNKANNYSGGGTIGNAFHYTSTHPPFKKTGREKAFFKPNLPKDGNYTVEVSWRATENRSTKVTYEVTYKGGTKRFVVNQREGKDMTWKTLGTFPFSAGREGMVAFISDGGGSASIDAARFTLGKKSSSLEDVLKGEENNSETPPEQDTLISLTNSRQGSREVTIENEQTINAEVYLSTYGQASLQIKINGETWISWTRKNDKDPSPCEVDGQPQADSMFEQKPGDFSAKKITISRKCNAGDVITASLKGNFGKANSSVSISQAADTGKK